LLVLINAGYILLDAFKSSILFALSEKVTAAVIISDYFIT